MARVKTEEKRRRILEVAAVVFGARGYHATNVSHIAAEVGMGLGTFYRYFESKLDVFHAVIGQLMAEVMTVAGDESPTASTTLDEYMAQTERIARLLFGVFQRNHAAARLLFIEAPGISPELNATLQETTRLFGEVTASYLENGVARGFLREDLDVAVTALMLNAITFEGARNLTPTTEPVVLDRWLAAAGVLMFDGVTRRP